MTSSTMTAATTFETELLSLDEPQNSSLSQWPAVSASTQEIQTNISDALLNSGASNNTLSILRKLFLDELTIRQCIFDVANSASSPAVEKYLLGTWLLAQVPASVPTSRLSSLCNTLAERKTELLNRVDSFEDWLLIARQVLPEKETLEVPTRFVRVLMQEGEELGRKFADDLAHIDDLNHLLREI